MAEHQPGLILTLSNGVQHAVRFGTRSDAEAAIDDFISGGARLGRERIRIDGQTAVARAHVISVTVVEEIGAQVAPETLHSTP